ncbi:MAG: hypothetical protein V4538_00230 [Bacteroidota bacterium]
MSKKSSFFERILQIAETHGYKNINDFAINGLAYASSEKINRLRDANKKPSVDILLDIANKFEKIDLNWLITGNGTILKSPDNNELLTLQQKLIAEMERNRLLEEQLTLLDPNWVNNPLNQVTKLAELKTIIADLHHLHKTIIKDKKNN